MSKYVISMAWSKISPLTITTLLSQTIKKISVIRVQTTHRIALIVLLLLCSKMFPQPKTFSSLSKYEKRWAFFHPFASFKIKNHQKEMYAVYEEVKTKNLLDQYANGGKLDAFRHAFAMAYFNRFVSRKKLLKLGKAHERGNYRQFLKSKTEDGEVPDSVSSVMDLNNNALGLLLGGALKKIPVEELKQKVIEQINAGTFWIIKRNSEGLYVDCSGNVIAPEKLKGKWGNEKCLILSSN